MSSYLFVKPIGQIFPNTSVEIFSVTSDDTVNSAFKKMVEKKVLSLPIFDTVHRRFNKFIDMVDIVTFCMKHLTSKELNDMDLNFIVETKDIFKSHKVGDICDLSERNPFCPVESSAPLNVAIELMVKWNVHRIPVIDSEGNLISILTQSRVIEYCNNHAMELNNEHQLSKRLDELPLIGTSPVLSIGDDKMAIEAFKLIYDNRVSAVSVVDKDEILVGNISVSDLRMIGSDGSLLGRLFLPINTFMAMVPKDTKSPFFNVICCRDSTTLEEVLVKFQLSKVHRIYLVDDQMKPKRCISQGDILKYLSL
ncbi:cystathionine-beta-synthase domain-containing protein [Cavenderia fasciculata]|uniref:Cystathionine-beta-synthase domain-containing protein n=1 Tax=Cavenderia fasciculata TaxID=261658 RepID=F4PIL8_CACFS|nr:cystathionine-beta-synthase domain-containing protein [Cavenderia fasciculata]EGG24598.1 cystathionine-beta-synthase domain-containing protein [Cavenderia fasciculata]|eukprot:XP_004362449.1 cystathionine-beta-synthase domain-containing protein [Cavenderia fasciculata]